MHFLSPLIKMSLEHLLEKVVIHCTLKTLCTYCSILEDESNICPRSPLQMIEKSRNDGAWSGEYKGSWMTFSFNCEIFYCTVQPCEPEHCHEASTCICFAIVFFEAEKMLCPKDAQNIAPSPFVLRDLSRMSMCKSLTASEHTHSIEKWPCDDSVLSFVGVDSLRQLIGVKRVNSVSSFIVTTLSRKLVPNRSQSSKFEWQEAKRFPTILKMIHFRINRKMPQLLLKTADFGYSIAATIKKSRN